MDDEEAFAITVHLLKTATGERVEYRTEGFQDPDNPGQFSSFIWEDGNFSCDCNRELFFARAKGLPEPDVYCSGGRFRVEKIVRDADGVVIYEESA